MQVMREGKIENRSQIMRMKELFRKYLILGAGVVCLFFYPGRLAYGTGLGEISDSQLRTMII